MSHTSQLIGEKACKTMPLVQMTVLCWLSISTGIGLSSDNTEVLELLKWLITHEQYKYIIFVNMLVNNKTC